MGKIIFITHDIGVYGASKSFQITLKNLIEKRIINKSDAIIIYPKTFRKFARVITKKQTNNSYLKNFSNKEGWVLPTSFGINVINVEYDNNFLSEAKKVFKLILLYIYWLLKYKRKMEKWNVEKVYLNSIILWPVLFVLPKKIKIIMHIREILDFNNNLISKFVKKLIIKKCYKLIAIDKKTAVGFENYKGKLIIVTNPVDMKNARELKKSKYQYLCEKYKVNPKKIHVSLIGRVSRVKGQDFYCSLAEKVELSNIFEFVIAGKGKNKYIDTISKKSKKIENLYYFGEIENIDEVYAITHILIRCDDFFPLGRTVWEAYYSGCKVLLPYNINDDISEIKDFLDKEIFLYKSRDIESAISKLKKITKQGFNIDNGLQTDNLDTYIKKISETLN